ncbi:hypothetical protein [Rhizobium sp. BK491]|uniref:hypothetical protein n=1 Tax=Rhizobium sp. BK491 TaxID=2587009 RepID=UPI00160C3A99|nr:hypothetical protein [Rhizobium sp. BK491]MBB3571863.1 hypothetical protein [Rhizobium sp. BK491]
MQTLFRFVPGIIYMASLLAIVLSMLVVRTPYANARFNPHCQHETYSDCELVRAD